MRALHYLDLLHGLSGIFSQSCSGYPDITVQLVSRMTRKILVALLHKH